MNNDDLRAHIKECFEKVDERLSMYKETTNMMMVGCSSVALLYAAKMVDIGMNVADCLSISGFGAFSAAARLTYKNIRKHRQNFELGYMLIVQKKGIPGEYYMNKEMSLKIPPIFICTSLFGLVSLLSGKLEEENFIFLMGNAYCACVMYDYYLNKNSRKVLAAEFPKGVIDEHVR